MEGKICMTIAEIIEQLAYKKKDNKLVPSKKALAIAKEIIISPFIANESEMLTVMAMLIKYDFRHDRLTKFYTQCCANDRILFNQTIKILNSGFYTKEEIDKNMELPMSLQLIDESVGSFVNPNGDLWQDYCEAQHKSFIKKVSDRVIKKED